MTTAVFSVVLVILFLFWGAKRFIKASVFSYKLKKFLVLWVIAMVWLRFGFTESIYPLTRFVVTLSYPFDMVLMLVLLVAACAFDFLCARKATFIPSPLCFNDFRYTLGTSADGPPKENLTNDNRFKGLLIALLLWQRLLVFISLGPDVLQKKISKPWREYEQKIVDLATLLDWWKRQNTSFMPFMLH